MREPKYTVYAADRAGSSWTVFAHDDPALVLAWLAGERAAWRNQRVFGVYLTDNPEAGDVEDRCEDEVSSREDEAQ